jgi:hypothetical protein
MFSVVDAVLINPLPFPNADRVLEIWTYFEAGAARSSGQSVRSPGRFANRMISSKR